MIKITINELLMGYVIALSALVIWKALELRGISPIGLLLELVYKAGIVIISVVCWGLLIAVIYVSGISMGEICGTPPQLAKIYTMCGTAIITGVMIYHNIPDKYKRLVEGSVND